MTAAIWDLVIEDMRARDAKGINTYGRRLEPFNGRDALQDAYEEALDLACYLKQAMVERDARYDEAEAREIGLAETVSSDPDFDSLHPVTQGIVRDVLKRGNR